MDVPFRLPTPKPAGAPPREDARFRLERLYREIGISAVAAALHVSTLPAPEERARLARVQHDSPAILAEDQAA